MYNIPFIGIEPAIKPAALITKTKKIGILATTGTLNSTLFEATSNAVGKDIQIKETIGKGLVELIEAGKLNSKEMTSLLSFYLKPMVASNIDSLVLGCTHYPYLIPQIRTILGSKIKIIDSGEAVAKQTNKILTNYNLLNSNELQQSKHTLYINKEKSVLEKLLIRSKNKEIEIIERYF
tara:strand:- start:1268 stop:1804 length:537 start_codon:yes stop_codon:yes gene_type:complete